MSANITPQPDTIGNPMLVDTTMSKSDVNTAAVTATLPNNFRQVNNVDALRSFCSTFYSDRKYLLFTECQRLTYSHAKQTCGLYWDSFEVPDESEFTENEIQQRSTNSNLDTLDSNNAQTKTSNQNLNYSNQNIESSQQKIQDRVQYSEKKYFLAVVLMSIRGAIFLIFCNWAYEIPPLPHESYLIDFKYGCIIYLILFTLPFGIQFIILFDSQTHPRLVTKASYIFFILRFVLPFTVTIYVLSITDWVSSRGVSGIDLGDNPEFDEQNPNALKPVMLWKMIGFLTILLVFLLPDTEFQTASTGLIPNTKELLNLKLLQKLHTDRHIQEIVKSMADRGGYNVLLQIVKIVLMVYDMSTISKMDYVWIPIVRIPLLYVIKLCSTLSVEVFVMNNPMPIYRHFGPVLIAQYNAFIVVAYFTNCQTYTEVILTLIVEWIAVNVLLLHHLGVHELIQFRNVSQSPDTVSDNDNDSFFSTCLPFKIMLIPKDRLTRISNQNSESSQNLDAIMYQGVNIESDSPKKKQALSENIGQNHQSQERSKLSESIGDNIVYIIRNDSNKDDDMVYKYQQQFANKQPDKELFNDNSIIKFFINKQTGLLNDCYTQDTKIYRDSITKHLTRIEQRSKLQKLLHESLLWGRSPPLGGMCKISYDIWILVTNNAQKTAMFGAVVLTYLCFNWFPEIFRSSKDHNCQSRLERFLFPQGHKTFIFIMIASANDLIQDWYTRKITKTCYPECRLSRYFGNNYDMKGISDLIFWSTAPFYVICGTIIALLSQTPDLDEK